MALQITVFTPPNGEQHVMDITDIDNEDELFFMEKRIKLSCEELRTGQRVVYGDWGRVHEGEPDESMVIVGPDVKFRAAIKLLRANIEMEMKLK